MASLDSKAKVPECDLRCDNSEYKRLTPCLPIFPPLKDRYRNPFLLNHIIFCTIFRCSSLVVDKSSSRMSCGSLSPIAPDQRYSRYKYGVNDVRIIVTDSLNNNSVFLNNNNDNDDDNMEAAEAEIQTQKFYTAMESSLRSRMGQSYNNRSTGPSKAG